MLLLFLSVLLAANAPAGGKLFQTDKSPSGTIVAEHFIFEPRDPQSGAPLRQIWLRYAQRKESESLLFEHRRDAVVIFSPDEKWIVINDNRLSDESDVRLFRKIKGLTYTELKKAQPGKKCWALFDRISGRRVSEKLDHHYVSATKWAPDSRAVLLITRGYRSGEERQFYAHDWQCVFEIDHLVASTDIRLMSRDVAAKDK